MPTTHDHRSTGHLVAANGHESIGRPVVTEPHPWGDPLPMGHPGYRPPRRLVISAFARWFVYATVLALTTTVITLIALAATQPTTTRSDGLAPTPMIVPLSHTTATGTSDDSGSQALNSNGGGVDRFVQTRDASRYHGPAPTLHAQGSGTGR